MLGALLADDPLFDGMGGSGRITVIVVVVAIVGLRLVLLRRRWRFIRAGGYRRGASTPESRPFGIGQDQPAGWYPDPAGEARFRWWDGDAWTPQTRQDHP